MKNHRRLVLVPLAAVAVALAFASVAYACTALTGTISTSKGGSTCPNTGSSRCSVSRGDTISSTGSNLNGTATDGSYWSLFFLNYKSTQDSMNTCMGLAGETRIGSPVQESSNSVSGTGTIPSNAGTTNVATGPALVCWITTSSSGTPNYNYATPSTELAVV